MIMRRILLSSLVLALSACNAYRLDPPEGFAEVDENRHGTRMKAGDDVGLNLRVFDNVDGGTLRFWSEDLVRKLGRRGYVLLAQSAVESKNGVAGTRFDFSYTVPGTEEKEEKFYSVALFVTDKRVFALQLAGDEAVRSRHLARFDGIAKDAKVRGCKPWKDTCDGPQPGKLSTPAPDTKLADAPATELTAETPER